MKHYPGFILAAGMLAGAFAPDAGAVSKGTNELSVLGGVRIFEGDANLDPGLIYGLRFGHFLADRFSAELSVIAGEAQGQTSGTDFNVLYPAASVSYHFLRYKKFLPFFQIGAGAMYVTNGASATTTDFAAHWGLGLKYFYMSDFLFRADVSHVIDTKIGKGTNDLLGALGMSWLFGPGQAE